MKFLYCDMAIFYLLVHFWPYLAIFDHLQLFTAIFGHFSAILTIFYHFDLLQLVEMLVTELVKMLKLELEL